MNEIKGIRGQNALTIKKLWRFLKSLQFNCNCTKPKQGVYYYLLNAA